MIRNEQLLLASLPVYLKKDLLAYEDGLKAGSSLLDCLYCELQASINSALWDKEISEETADHLTKSYLGIEV